MAQDDDVLKSLEKLMTLELFSSGNSKDEDVLLALEHLMLQELFPNLVQDPYQTCKLPATSRHIRVLELAPGKNGALLDARLVAVELGHLDYEALSYCWGASNSPCNITIDGRRLSITQSLHDALYRLRLPDQPRTIWADAICINQADDVEKSSQIMLMGEIYSSAQRVLVWLGNDNVLREGAQAMRDIKQFKSVEHRNQRPDAAAMSLWKSMLFFFNLPWFRRAWIVQEVVMAREVKYICGASEAGSLDLSSAGEAFKVAYPRNMPGYRNVPTTTPRKDGDDEGDLREPAAAVEAFSKVQKFRAVRCLLSSKSTYLENLSDTLRTFHNCLSTDPRDKVYAMMGLTRQAGDIALKADYSLSVQSVYVRTAGHLVCAENRSMAMDILFAAGLPSHENVYWPLGIHRLVNLPSWVPDWSIPKANVIGHGIGRPTHEGRYNAGGSSSPVMSTSSDGWQLIATGISVDRIDLLMPCPWWNLDSMINDFKILELQSHFVELDHLFGHSKPFGHADNVASSTEQAVLVHETQWRTLVANLIRLPTGTYVVADHAAGQSYVKFRRHLYHAATEIVNDYDSWETEKVEWVERLSDWASVSRDGESWVSEWAHLMNLYDVCRTTLGNVGIVPKGSVVGDKLFIFPGGGVPFMLRPASVNLNTYRLVGGCYINGIMNGEIVLGKSPKLEQVCLV